MRICRLTEVTELVGLCKSSIYRKVADGTFPAPIKISERAIGWTDTVISEWIESRIAESERDSGGEQ